MDIVIKNTIILLDRKKWEHTDKGQRKANMLAKGIALSVSWDTMKEITTVPERVSKFPKMIDDIKEALVKYEHKGDYDKDIKIFLEKVYEDPTNFRMLKVIDKFATDNRYERPGGHHLRFAKEEEVCNAIVDYIKKKTDITSVKYVKGLIYSTHIAFYCIGREYEWGDRQSIRMVSDHNNKFLNGGNPLSHSSLKTIRETFANDIKPNRLPKFQIEDMNGEKQEWNKQKQHLDNQFHEQLMIEYYGIFAGHTKSLTMMIGTKTMVYV